MGEDLDAGDCANVKVKQQDQELEKHYKRCLENWREVLVHMNSLLLWDKSYYPGIIISYITFIFMILWYFEPSLLTTLAMLGIIGCILDFAVPALSSCVFDSNKWSGVQERKFEEICQNLIHLKKTVHESYAYITKFKETKPKMYFVGVVTGLIFLAWIGNIFNNLLLMYLFVLTLLLLPGLKHRGILDQHVSQIMKLIKDLIAEKTKQN